MAFYTSYYRKMKKLIFLFLSFHITTGLNAQIDTLLTNRLDAMVKADQKWRGLIRQINNGEIDSISLDVASNHMQQTDSLNTTELKDIFNQYGFVGYDIAGQKGSHNFWLLVQHQDKDVDFQRAVLEQMKVAAENKNASYQDYAYLLDRVNVNQGQPQVYGTQMTFNADTTSYIPMPLTEPEKLNKRRKKAGLPPIEFYIDAMNKRYFGTIKKE